MFEKHHHQRCCTRHTWHRGAAWAAAAENNVISVQCAWVDDEWSRWVDAHLIDAPATVITAIEPSHRFKLYYNGGIIIRKKAISPSDVWWPITQIFLEIYIVVQTNKNRVPESECHIPNEYGKMSLSSPSATKYCYWQPDRTPIHLALERLP